MPRLSILIPALSDSREFEYTLASVLQNRPDDCEVLVAHAWPYADPYKLSGDVCFVPVLQARNVVELLNCGFEAACSGIIHVVQCGLEVEEGWTEQALDLFDDEQVASVSPVVVDSATRDRILSAGLGYSRWGRSFAGSAGRKLSQRRRLSNGIVGPTLAAGFYRRSWWRLVRWDETLGDDFADAHFNLTLAQLGAATRLAEDCILRSECPCGLAADEPFGFATARRAERLFWRHCQSSYGLGTVALRTAIMLAESILALPNPRAVTGLAGRLAGLLGRDAREFQTHVAELAARLAVDRVETHSTATLSLSDARQHRAKATPAKRAA